MTLLETENFIYICFYYYLIIFWTKTTRFILILYHTKIIILCQNRDILLSFFNCISFSIELLLNYTVCLKRRYHINTLNPYVTNMPHLFLNPAYLSILIIFLFQIILFSYKNLIADCTSCIFKCNCGRIKDRSIRLSDFFLVFNR